MKKGRVQIVGRIPGDLSRRVRATAKRRKLTLNAFVIDALSQVLGTSPRVVKAKEPR